MLSRAESLVSARFAVVLGQGAGDVRRRVGPTAWCALEVMAASATRGRGGDGLRVDASVRSVAVELGVSKNTAHRAMRAFSLRSHHPDATARWRRTLRSRHVHDCAHDRSRRAVTAQSDRSDSPAPSSSELAARFRSSSSRCSRPSSSPCPVSKVLPQHAEVSSDKCPRVGGSWVVVGAAGDDPPRGVRGGDGVVLRAVLDGGAGGGAGYLVGASGGRARPVRSSRGRCVGGVVVGP